MSEKKKSNYTMVRIKRTTQTIAKRQAAKQRRSVANYVDNLILDDADRTPEEIEARELVKAARKINSEE